MGLSIGNGLWQHLLSSYSELWTKQHSKKPSMPKKQTIGIMQLPSHQVELIVHYLWHQGQTSNPANAEQIQLVHSVRNWDTEYTSIELWHISKNRERSAETRPPLDEPKASRVWTRWRKQKSTTTTQCHCLIMTSQQNSQTEQVWDHPCHCQPTLMKTGMQTLGPLLIWPHNKTDYLITKSTMSW